MTSLRSRPLAPPRAEPLDYVPDARLVVRYGARPPVGPTSAAPLPDWLDLLMCVLATCGTSLVAALVFHACRWLLAA